MATLRSTAKQVRELIQNHVYRPSHLRLNLQDYFDLRTPSIRLQPNATHVRAAMDWLCRAQDVTHDHGVAARYRLDSGWAASYAETTGYIIPTFFDYAKLTQIQEYSARARRMAGWLLSVQLECGAFPAHDASKNPEPRVFNTGQVMIGLLRTYLETGQKIYLKACTRAGDWLVAIQEPNGSWLQFTYCQRVHAYHTRVAWPLLQLSEVTKESRYRESAVKHLDWVLTLQRPNGWFDKNGFNQDDQSPYLHTIAYTINGLLESGALLQPDQPIQNPYVQAALRASEALLHRFEIRRFMAGQFDSNWKGGAMQYSCLTGNAQTAINWLRLYEFARDPRFLNGALKLNDFVKSTQDLRSGNPNIRGGIKGSHPIWGRYIHYGYPNWAAKFFVDALMQEDKIIGELYRVEGIA
jgi:hypothetical protein